MWLYLSFTPLTFEDYNNIESGFEFWDYEDCVDIVLKSIWDLWHGLHSLICLTSHVYAFLCGMWLVNLGILNVFESGKERYKHEHLLGMCTNMLYSHVCFFYKITYEILDLRL